jgi:hypothetical protein
MRFPLRTEIPEGIGYLAKDLIPGDRFPTILPSLSHPLEGGPDTIGVVQTLKACNSLRTQGPAIHRVERISGDIHNPTIDGPGKDSAASHALGTDRGDPLFNTGSIGLLRDDREL